MTNRDILLGIIAAVIGVALATCADNEARGADDGNATVIVDTEGLPARPVIYSLGERRLFLQTYPWPSNRSYEWKIVLLRPQCQGGHDVATNTYYMEHRDAIRMQWWQCREDWDARIRECTTNISRRVLDCTRVRATNFEEFVWRRQPLYGPYGRL